MSIARVITATWRLASLPSASRFAHSLTYPGDIQRQRLLRLISAQANTTFGRAHGFSTIHDAHQFRERVPLQSWNDVAPWVARLSAGEQGVLTRERVTRLIPTGGSSGGAKYIPWTAGLAREFQAAIAPWVVDLHATYPASAAGPAYWSVSPLTDSTTQTGALPVGFEDDSAYVGGLLRPLVAATLAAPACLRHIADLETFRYATLRCLLGQRELAMMSVWHPSFLTLLLDSAPGFRADLLRDIEHGGITPPSALPASVLAGMAGWLRAGPCRADELRAAEWRNPRELWPRLAVVSCWADSAAAPACTALQRRLGNIAIQPKGLLATEGVITIPYAGSQVLAVTSHVHEFIDAQGRAHWADELENGASYEVALTTAGGLYRYRLGDRVRVTGFMKRTPCLRFLGRGDRVVDLCGEKLDEAFVAECLAQVMGRSASLAFLAPDSQDGIPAYTLYFSGEVMPGLMSRLEATLSTNPHYRLARRLGQLGKPRLFQVVDEAEQVYVSHLAATTTCLGAVKPTALHNKTGWSQRFSGAYQTMEEG